MIEHWCFHCGYTRRFQWMRDEYVGGQCWELYSCEFCEAVRRFAVAV